MADNYIEQEFDIHGQNPFSVQRWIVDLVVPAATTTIQVVSPFELVGWVAAVRINPGVVKANATIRGWQQTQPVISTTEAFLLYVAATTAEKTIYPRLEALDNTGAVFATKQYSMYIVSGICVLELGSGSGVADPADDCRVEVIVIWG